MFGRRSRKVDPYRIYALKVPAVESMARRLLQTEKY